MSRPATAEQIRQQIKADDGQFDIWHYFASRIFHGRPPVLGDVALCGCVKRGNARIEDYPANHPHETCVVCADLLKGLRR